MYYVHAVYGNSLNIKYFHNPLRQNIKIIKSLLTNNLPWNYYTGQARLNDLAIRIHRDINIDPVMVPNG